ncbi:uncharacterized protein KY384_004211 [Bacidia gigantensis]|uniref:uncharacterized protein n=1 Tax=Bacidia gigantensis TaxID=2732470 RepID=UPI001D04E3B9|nr:uncharacterized protein KY384_004211 [Bacidia gigantensis]KAG8530854.1 hypothetical protein KY384_004211 [Bacidia gigantensis]
MQPRKRPYVEQQDADAVWTSPQSDTLNRLMDFVQDLYRPQPPKPKRRLQQSADFSCSVPSTYSGWPEEDLQPAIGNFTPQPATMAPSCMHLVGALNSEDYLSTTESHKHDSDIDRIFAPLSAPDGYNNSQVIEKIDQMNQDLLPMQSHLSQTIEPRPRFTNEPWPSFDTSQMQPPPMRCLSNSQIPNSLSYSQVPNSVSTQVCRASHPTNMILAGKEFSEGALPLDSGYGSNVVSPLTPSVLSSHGDPTCPSNFSKDFGNQPLDCQSLTNGFDGLDVTSQAFESLHFDFFAETSGQFGSKASSNFLQVDQKIPEGPPWICDMCEIGQLKNKSEYKVYQTPEQLEDAVVSQPDDSTNLDALASDVHSSSSSSFNNLLSSTLKHDSSSSLDAPASSLIQHQIVNLQDVLSKVHKPNPEQASQNRNELRALHPPNHLPLSKYQIHTRHTQPAISHPMSSFLIEQDPIITNSDPNANKGPRSVLLKSSNPPLTCAGKSIRSQDSTKAVPSLANPIQNLTKGCESQDTKRVLPSHKSSDVTTDSSTSPVDMVKTHPLIAQEARRMARILYAPGLLLSVQNSSSQKVEAYIRASLHRSFLEILVQDRSKRLNPCLKVDKGKVVPPDRSQCPICFKVNKTRSDLRYVKTPLLTLCFEHTHDISNVLLILRLEDRKHMQRHDRPYTCTAHESHVSHEMCTKTFGSKSDWKRHERTMHEDVSLMEAWWCFLPHRPPAAISDSTEKCDEGGNERGRRVETHKDSSTAAKNKDDISEKPPSETRCQDRKPEQKSSASSEGNRCTEPGIPNAEVCQHTFYSKDEFYEHLIDVHSFEKPVPPLDWPPDPSYKSSSRNSPAAASFPTDYRSPSPSRAQHTPTPPPRPEYPPEFKQAKTKCKEAKRKAHIGHNGIDGFWCGYCNTVIHIDRQLRGPPAWEARYRHIDEMHFRQKGKGPQEDALRRNGSKGFAWVVLGVGKTKGKLLQEEAEKLRRRRETGNVSDEGEDKELDDEEREESRIDHSLESDHDAQEVNEAALQPMATSQSENGTSSPSRLSKATREADMDTDEYDFDEDILDASKEATRSVNSDTVCPRASPPNVISETNPKKYWRQWTCSLMALKLQD